MTAYHRWYTADCWLRYNNVLIVSWDLWNVSAMIWNEHQKYWLWWWLCKGGLIKADGCSSLYIYPLFGNVYPYWFHKDTYNIQKYCYWSSLKGLTAIILVCICNISDGHIYHEMNNRRYWGGTLPTYRQNAGSENTPETRKDFFLSLLSNLYSLF